MIKISLIEDFAVIVTWSKDNTNPGCLVELGYITNVDDLKKKGKAG